ncbi:MAG: putative zinc-binding metallopeptidase [Pirellulaceae bacterium]|nr:putative zinc-binding metallopeptidase [Pirellulaceae bacterium]
MRTFKCICGNKLFFDNTRCIGCDRATALCPNCRQVTPRVESTDNTFQCANDKCSAKLRLCENAQYDACNCGIDAADNASLCKYCRLNAIIPDLSIEENRSNWQKLEAAKRRVLYALEDLGFRIDSKELPLSFEFKSDVAEKVSTGHAEGCITICLNEADSVKREQVRVQFGEPHRTLVGHFRHELGHYYWGLLVAHNYLRQFRSLFGDETNPTYTTARNAYYQNGNEVLDWHATHISRYSTMHPWEDFAETFNAYLDLRAVVQSALHFGLLSNVDANDFDSVLLYYQKIGIVTNELNRDMGLLDLVPEVFTTPVIEKLRFIDRLRH